MAKKKNVAKTKTFSEAIGLNNLLNDNTNFVLGLALTALSICVIIAFLSYFKTGAEDQSMAMSLRPGEIFNRSGEFKNICGSLGALVSYYMIDRWFGIPAFLAPLYILLCGLKIMGVYKNVNLIQWFFGLMLLMIWGSVTMGKFLAPIMGEQVFNPGGGHGAYVCQWLENVVGSPGLVAILLVVAIAFLTYLTSETISVIRKMLNPVGYLANKVKFTIVDGGHHKEASEDVGNRYEETDVNVQSDPTIFDDPQPQTVEFLQDDVTNGEAVSIEEEVEAPKREKNKQVDAGEVSMSVEVAKSEEKATGKVVAQTDLTTPINPREPFLSWKFPKLDLLKEYDSDGKPNYATKEELEANKNRIIKVLDDFGVQIRSIRATVGPTITLYEITPAQGIRISKIKNLEDDIALNLAATGIRIIAPMPGKGTIGIEVPNANPNIVSMFSILNSKKFQETDMELPIALGKTITNDVFMVDLAKIPHLLVAGATGQGKSVGLNAIITSLLYKKHPNELKIVLIDPKKVEFSTYGPIANHFMAAVEENENEPIITDVQKVVKTLKGLCVLMDERYDMLKAAGARNIKEYNQKYLSHRLNPDNGHAYMPYIVVVIDEFGDLMLTAGKEVETPITRIAQLARAVGIHMIIATQRPTTTIITGNIKANFPGRIAFRVGSMMDSRIILDRPGAQQLVGRGDMLYLNGGEPVRVQCAFVETAEVEKISLFIANQLGPIEPLLIPEPETEESGVVGGGLDTHNLDPLFEEAARSIVLSQQGSTCMIQRRFSIGYNRAGRLMDQLERSGIVGEAKGSKPREVLISDENSLAKIFEAMRGR